MAAHAPPVKSWLRGIKRNSSGGSGFSSRASSAAATPQPQQSATSLYATALNGGVRDPSGKTAEFRSDDDTCPICKSDRYLNAKLRLLVSSCYHKMCESCIDRIFTLGPAPCPTPGCGKIQRKMGFAPQTFEDLDVEKEVAVRRRMHKDFNKRPEDFIDLRAYNDYQEWVEEMTFNLINEVDVGETEAQIAQFKAENAAILEENARLEEHTATELREEEERDRAQRELNARELQAAEDTERAAREQERRSLIDQLQSSDAPAHKVIKLSRIEAQKRVAQRAVTGNTRPSSQLLRSRMSSTIADPPHKPLADDWWDYSDQFTLRDAYDDPLSDFATADADGVFRAGGYIVQEAWTRAIASSLAGLDLPPVRVEVPDVVMANT